MRIVNRSATVVSVLLASWLELVAGLASVEGDIAIQTADGRSRVVVRLSNVGLGVDTAVDGALPAQGTAVQMRHVTTVPPSVAVLSSKQGIDSDHDGQREFLIRKDVGDLWTTALEFHESIGDDAFDVVSVLQVPPDGGSSYYPGDVGDADGDGKTELTIFGRTENDFFLRLYESESPDTHPTNLVWEAGGAVADGFFWQVGAKIADTDNDGKREVVSAGVFLDGQRRIVVYENDADNSYHLSYSQAFPSINTEQSMAVGDDLDADGRDEIFFGGWGAGTGEIYAVESTDDDTYQQVWHTGLALPVNVEFIVSAGDLDGDGRKEFLAGGRQSSVPPYSSVLYVFEATGDNNFVPVASFVLPLGLGYSRANVADVDGDGKKEIVFGTDKGVTLYGNTGDNTWAAIWSSTGSVKSIGVGDHDGDGKAEVIVQKAGATWVWEIYPQYAADLDGDGWVDVVDNCSAVANPGQEDADCDTVGDVCDNCAYGPNPDQGPAVLGQTLVAPDSNGFAWSKPADVIYIRGPLAGVGTYAVDVIGTLPLSQGLVDGTAPAPGTGLYYLVKPDCPVGSWQSSLGAEPGRDELLP